MGSNQNEDKMLMRKLKEGDEEAFRNIYQKYYQELYTVAVKYLRSKNLAEDAIHDVFVKLWDSKDSLDQSGSLSGFLFTSLKNHVFNMVNARQRKLKKEIKHSQEKDRDKDSASTAIDFSKYQEVYEQAIQKLPEARRQVFELRMKEGLTNKEVAEYQDISINTVKSQFYKGSKFVRNYVKKHALNIEEENSDKQ